MPMTDAHVREGVSSEQLNSMRDRLRKRAYLYDSPEDFRAGVEAALNALIRETRRLDLDVALSELEKDLDLTPTS